MMKLLSILIFLLTLAVVISQNVLAQETITGCEQRYGIRTEMGGVVEAYQAIAACRELCSREFWKEVGRKEDELEETR